MVPITENDLALFRERAKTELKSTGDIGRLAWDDVVEALCKEVARLRSVSKERGNAAKLREALVKCRDIALQWQADEAAGVAGTTDKPHARSAAEAVIDMEFEINAALAAPPRNCDRFATVDEARKAHEAICEKYGKCHNGCPLNNEEHYSAFDCFEAWLYAPSTEKEGGAK